MRLVEGVAAQVGLGMENAELARQTEQKLQETETLLSVSQALASTLDLDALARQFLRHVAGAAGRRHRGHVAPRRGRQWMTPFAGYHVPAERSPRSATCASASTRTRSSARRPAAASR